MPHRPRLTLAIVALVTLTLLPAAVRVRVDSAVDRLLPQGDPARARLDRARATFGSEDVVLVALFADDVLAPATLARLARLTRRIAALDVVRSATSIANLEEPRSGPDGLGRAHVLPPAPWTPAVLARVRADLARHPLARAGILAADGRAAGIVARLVPMTDDALLTSRLTDRLRAVVAAEPGPEPVAITGLPVLKIHAARAMVHDVLLFFTLGVGAVAAVLLAGFRTVRGLVLPLASVLVALVWTAAVMTLSGDAYTLGTLVLPPLLLAVGIAYAMHVVSRWEHERARGGTGAAAARRALRHVRMPITMAALTTLAGFAAFLRNPIPTIRDFGWYAAVGLGCMLGASLLVLPSALALLPAAPPSAGAGERRGWIDRFVAACTALALGRPRTVALAAAAIAAAAALGMGRIAIETDYLRFFGPNDPARVDNARAAARLVGTQIVSVTLRGDRPEAMTRLEAVAGLRDLVAFVAAQPGVDHVASFLDHLDMLRQAVEPERAAVPLATQAALDQRLMLVSPEATRAQLSSDHAAAQVIVYTRLSGSREVRALARRIEAHAAARLPPAITADVSGTLVLLARSADTLATQEMAGLGEVFVALALLLVALFRSVRLGLLSLVPNLFPVVVLFGIMGWSGIDLDVSTSMIACIAIGIAVDDTIHYLTTWQTARRTSTDERAAITATAHAVGRPVVLTSVALALGFLVPCLSSFQPVRHFGMLASSTMVVALFADLLLLPVLLLSYRGALGGSA